LVGRFHGTIADEPPGACSTTEGSTKGYKLRCKEGLKGQDMPNGALRARLWLMVEPLT
jgi:hypothetical protein